MDCDLDSEVTETEGSRGIYYNDTRTVASTRMGVTSRERYDKLASKGFFDTFDRNRTVTLLDSDDDLSDPDD